MKKLIPYLVLFISVLFFIESCRKDDLLTDPSAMLTFSADTVYFDTVFTNVGSSTRQLKVYNPHNRKIVLSNIMLAKGNASPYRINIDGMPGPFVKNLEILPKDSAFIFVEVTIDPLSINSPLIVTDSLIFELNGKIQDVDLVAWGQNAHYIRPTHYLEGFPPFSIIGCDTTWRNDIPHVIYGYAVVDSTCKLTIEEGTKIHFHNNSGLWIYKGGSLKVNGSKDRPVIFQGDRLEPYYRELPGQWDRIWLNEGSIDNEINYAIIKNGLIGIQAETLQEYMGNELKLNNTIIKNMSRSGLLTKFYKITAGNSVIANCGLFGAELTMGGYYEFNHCTFANYWRYKARKENETTLLILNYYKDHNNQINTAPLYKADFNNCIVYGSLENEILTDDVGQGVEFNYSFNYSLLRTNKTLNGDNIFLNEDPLFENVQENIYRLGENSPARNRGNPIYAVGVTSTTIEGETRTGNPDLGAY